MELQQTFEFNVELIVWVSLAAICFEERERKERVYGVYVYMCMCAHIGWMNCQVLVRRQICMEMQP